MGIEEQQKQAQEEATRARNKLKKKWSKRANYVFVILIVLTTVVWYVRFVA